MASILARRGPNHPFKLIMPLGSSSIFHKITSVNFRRAVQGVGLEEDVRNDCESDKTIRHALLHLLGHCWDVHAGLSCVVGIGKDIIEEANPRLATSSASILWSASRKCLYSYGFRVETFVLKSGYDL